jgi:hypothetical protein
MCEVRQDGEARSGNRSALRQGWSDSQILRGEKAMYEVTGIEKLDGSGKSVAKISLSDKRTIYVSAVYLPWEEARTVKIGDPWEVIPSFAASAGPMAETVERCDA